MQKLVLDFLGFHVWSSVDEIMQATEVTNRQTIYNTLHILKNKGLVENLRMKGWRKLHHQHTEKV